MIHIVKLILFALVAFAGYWVVPAIVVLAVKFHMLPLLPDALRATLQNNLGIGGIIWLVCCLISIGYFFAGKKSKAFRAALILAPLYGPLLFGIAVVAYFRYFANLG